MSILRDFYLILKSQSLVKFNNDPYSTHVPVLIGLSSAYGFQKVVEYGSGLNSTLLFLNKLAFSALTELKSYENYKEWYLKVRDQLSSDSVDYNFVDGLMANSVDLETIQNSDLVFVDDSYTAADRSKTIMKVLKFNPSVCVIHDFENFSYRFSCFKSGKKYFRFKSVLPNVGVVGHGIEFDVCKKIDTIISKYSPLTPNNDVAAWVKIFQMHLVGNHV